MAMPNPNLDPLVLSDEECSVLTGWARRQKTAEALALRSRIVLRCAEGGSIGEVAADVGVSRSTVSKWRSRFVSDRLEGLSDEPRPGQPRSITDDKVDEMMSRYIWKESYSDSLSTEWIRKLFDACCTAGASGSTENLTRLESILRSSRTVMENPESSVAYGRRARHMISRIVAASLLCAGFRGVHKLRELASNAYGHVNGPAVVETLWRAARGQPLPAMAREYTGYVEQFQVDVSIQRQAKVVLDDLIIEAEKNAILRNNLFGFISDRARSSSTFLMGPDSIRADEFAHYVFEVLRASSIRLTTNVLDQLDDMIKSALPERAYQRFLEDNPVLLDPLAAEIIPQARLGTEFVADYAVRRHDFRYVAVEIKKPQDSIVTKKNNFSAVFTRAVGQVLDVQGWVNENVSYAQKMLPEIENPYGLVIIGRRGDMSVDEQAKLRRWCANSRNIEVLTFDDLVDRGRYLHRSLRTTNVDAH
jgi:hypothetical protein